MKNVWLKIVIFANIKKGLYKLELLWQSEFFMNLSLITHWKYAVSCIPPPIHIAFIKHCKRRWPFDSDGYSS